MINKTKYTNKEILIIGIFLGVFYLSSKIISENNPLVVGLFAALGLIIGIWIVKLLRKKRKWEI